MMLSWVNFFCAIHQLKAIEMRPCWEGGLVRPIFRLDDWSTLGVPSHREYQLEQRRQVALAFQFACQIR